MREVSHKRGDLGNLGRYENYQWFIPTISCVVMTLRTTHVGIRIQIVLMVRSYVFRPTSIL